MRATISRLVGRRSGRSHKHASELAYWREQRERQGDLAQSSAHYARYFTELFDVPLDFYAGKRMLDIGCGPRGSLIWAQNAQERVGLDPLADEYVRLHERPQPMTYVKGDAEHIPYPDAYFDHVSTINSIDHVDEPASAIAEITRVARPGAALLLIVDVNHGPTPTEPHRLGWDFPERFAGWDVTGRRAFERHGDNMYDNLFFVGEPYEHAGDDSRPGVLAARLERRA